MLCSNWAKNVWYSSFLLHFQAPIRCWFWRRRNQKREFERYSCQKTVAEMLVKCYVYVENLKKLFGDEYTDYNLAFALYCGRPVGGQVINWTLKKLIDDNDLPHVMFHSFRHSIITCKKKRCKSKKHSRNHSHWHHRQTKKCCWSCFPIQRWQRIWSRWQKFVKIWRKFVIALTFICCEVR